MRRNMCFQQYCLLLVLSMSRLVGSRHAATVRMLVSDQPYTLQAGNSLDLPCVFHMERFNLFRNPILWKKRQIHEETKVNIMGNIAEPFMSTGRFNVSFLQQPPKYTFLLHIVDVSLEDYGNYTCEIRGPQTTVLASLTHQIYIKSPVRSISISDYKTTITDMVIERQLEFSEGEFCSLHCVSYGGCPPPLMTLQLGKTELTSRFSLDFSSELTGQRGLRIVEHRTERWTNRFEIKARHDNQRLQCSVTVPGLGTNISLIKIRVNYAPIFTCEKKSAYVGDKLAFLRCDIDARPPLTALYWVIDDKGTSVTEGPEGAVHNGYWVINMPRQDNEKVTDSRLYIRETREESFRQYTLVAENRVGRTTGDLKLGKLLKVSTSHQSVIKVLDGNRRYVGPSEGVYHHEGAPRSGVTPHQFSVTSLLSAFLTCRILHQLVLWQHD